MHYAQKTNCPLSFIFLNFSLERGWMKEKRTFFFFFVEYLRFFVLQFASYQFLTQCSHILTSKQKWSTFWGWFHSCWFSSISNCTLSKFPVIYVFFPLNLHSPKLFLDFCFVSGPVFCFIKSIRFRIINSVGLKNEGEKIFFFAVTSRNVLEVVVTLNFAI